jgi:hypothetical protein
MLLVPITVFMGFFRGIPVRQITDALLQLVPMHKVQDNEITSHKAAHFYSHLQVGKGIALCMPEEYPQVPPTTYIV